MPCHDVTRSESCNRLSSRRKRVMVYLILIVLAVMSIRLIDQRAMRRESESPKENMTDKIEMTDEQETLPTNRYSK